jgi:hypothetical protein
MKSSKSLLALTATTPLALAAVLAAAPQAGAAVGNATVSGPRVLDNGRTLSVMLGNAVSDVNADDAMAQQVTAALAGNGIGDLVAYAMRNSPQRTSTCNAAVTATDPNGAGGTGSAVLRTGQASNEIRIPDQAAGTKWAVGDFDHFAVKVTCTDTSGTGMSVTTVDQDGIATQ